MGVGDFTASGCDPCSVIELVVAELVKKYHLAGVVFFKVDVDELMDFLSQFRSVQDKENKVLIRVEKGGVIRNPKEITAPFHSKTVHRIPDLAQAGQQVAPEALAAHAAWVKGSKEIQAEHELLQTVRNFHSCKQEEGQSVSSYILKMKSYIDNLEHLGHPVSLNLGVSKIQKVNNKHKKPQPQLAAKGQNQGKRKNKLAYAPKPKIPPPPKREDPAKDSICIFTIELYTFPNKFWVYDIGCGTHICNTTQGLRGSRKQKPGALILHISKKRIVKLQHNGLINPTDLRAFEKCISCMSGKTARKPYTHQVKRAKYLLRLIHTDVCGLFRIMSRQGASYFVTFTDDFSRYGYVYMLKHKHEVFETFKVFQKEVENQLGKTIKSLRSDRGGEYISQEFLEHLKEHGIIAHRTPPYTLQHNGVSRRRNRTILDMVRSMMSQTTLP
ncbi:retrotransposon protein, putative, ty1-copia subclass [Tanacetum coccineum]